MTRIEEPVPLMDDPRTYTAVALRTPPLPHDELVRVIRRAQAGDTSARKQAIETNLRLVFDIAQQFQRPDYTLADATQDGVAGLATAIDTYEVGGRFRFSTYAHRWIWQSIQRGIASAARTIRMPVHIEGEWLVIRQTARYLTEKHHGRQPTTQEIADFSGLPVARIELLTHTSVAPSSLQSRLDTDDTGSDTIGDIVADTTVTDPGDVVADADERAFIARSLDDLDEQERAVILHRFGLAGHERRDLQGTARALGLERIEVRRIERRALQKLHERTAT